MMLNDGQIVDIYWGLLIGIMEKKMETTILGLYKVLGLGLRVLGFGLRV